MSHRLRRLGVFCAAVALAVVLVPSGISPSAAASLDLRVTVVFDDGSGPTPVSGARVHLAHAVHGDSPNFGAGGSTTDSNGTVQVRNLTGYWGYDTYLRAMISSGEYGEHRVVPTFENDVVDPSLATVRIINQRDAYDSTQVTIVMRPAASLSGSVAFSGASAGNRVEVIAHRLASNGSWVAVDRTTTLSNGTFVFDGLPIGTYVVETRSATGSLSTASAFHPGVDDPDDATTFVLASGEAESTGTIAAPAWTPDVSRLSGANRYETSIAISRSMTSAGEGSSVFIASGESFADALSAAPVAASVGGSLLLTPPDYVTPAIIAELRRIEPDYITIVGGTAVVSRAIENRLDTLAASWGGEVDRLAGANRYETSAMLVNSGAWSWPRDRMFIATGRNFADALAAAAAAGAERFPVLLIDGELTRFSDTTINVLNSFRPSVVYVAGGGSAVSVLAINRWQFDDGIEQFHRFAGSDRFATGELINDFFFDSADGAVIANGLQFPDALGAAPLAVSLGGPLHLSMPTCLRPQLRSLLLRQGTDEIVLVGGTSALSSRVAALRSC